MILNEMVLQIFGRCCMRLKNVVNCVLSLSKRFKITRDICMLALHVSKLDSFELLDARIESRDLSRDCQLTFERYCSPLNEGTISLGFFFIALSY